MTVCIQNGLNVRVEERYASFGAPSENFKKNLNYIPQMCSSGFPETTVKLGRNLSNQVVMVTRMEHVVELLLSFIDVKTLSSPLI